METILKIQDLHKSFDDKEILKGINLEIKKGEIISKIPEDNIVPCLIEEIKKMKV